MSIIGAFPFAGFHMSVIVNPEGKIRMYRFGSPIVPKEAEKLGLALIKAAAISEEINKREQ